MFFEVHLVFLLVPTKFHNAVSACLKGFNVIIVQYYNTIQRNA